MASSMEVLATKKAVSGMMMPFRRCRRSSSFLVSTARREIHGDRKELLPPTLQGFLRGDGGEEDDDDDKDLTPRGYGHFTNLQLGTSSSLIVVDPSISFLKKKLPENQINHIYLLDSCNGLLLLGHLRDDDDPETRTLEYIVCNPATEQWIAVPSCDWVDWHPHLKPFATHTYLLFDPVVSSHFHIVLFWEKLEIDLSGAMATAHAYSSETGAWRHSKRDWSEEERNAPCEGWRREIDDFCIARGYASAVVDGMLYLILEGNRILMVDTDGKTRRIIPAPGVPDDAADKYVPLVQFVGQSQGRLHCIISIQEDEDHIRSSLPGLGIWVLDQEDHDDTSSNSQKWVIKHRVSYKHLFGKRRSLEGMVDYHVVAMHPDCNLVFFLQHWDGQLISYDIDRQEVCGLCNLQHDYRKITQYHHRITPYVPYLSELFLGHIGAHK